jgi:hypothetical protein
MPRLYADGGDALYLETPAERQARTTEGAPRGQMIG